ncbi:TonB-dependent hemoglobin/transferrin/lactoferrin family receptor [Sphingomonas sp. HF-S3]|uniref:TonB-dependent hemoglobin/transferrin/lactoferrin family receptor n=1 Tax=Sphingomonas rustica TaxID=3103142 RepID=A0ABV0B3F6_9SPHN
MNIGERVKLLAGAGIVALTAALPGAAQAQDMASAGETGQITVTATRIPVATQDAPATVSVIDDRQIADELATDIKDLVRFEPGVSVPRGPTRFGAALGVTGRAGNEGFIIRGIGGNRVLIQVDGVRVPDGFTFGAQAAGRGDYVDLGLIKSVEILRGPTSALYGSDGLSGAVSFITSDPADFLRDGNSVGGLVRAAYSSADSEFAETAILAGRSGDWSVMAAYTRRDYNELENQGTVGGRGAARTIANPQDGRSNAALGRIVWEPGTGHRFRLTGEYLDTRLDTDVQTGLSSTVDLLQARDTGKRTRIAADWSWQGAGLVEYARLAAFWQDAEDVQFTDEDRTPAADRERLNTFENRVYGASGEVRLAPGNGMKLLFGGDLSFTDQKGLRDGVLPPAGEVFPTRAFPETDYMLAGLFAAGEVEVGPLTLYPALRFDAYDLKPEKDPLLPAFTGAQQDGQRVSPKLGAVLKLGDHVRLFGTYAHGFKAPEPGQVNQFFENIAFGYTSRPNPNLGPETSRSIEGGVRFAFDWLNVDLTAFHADFDDFISQEVVGGGFTPANPAIYQFVNLDRAEVSGAEARIRATASWGLTANLSISWAKGEVTDPDGSRSSLSTVDPLKVVAGLGYRDPAGRFGGQLIATHAAQKEEGQTRGVCATACYRPGAFTILDATAFFKVTRDITVRAGVFNLFDRRYAMWNDVRGLADSSTIKDAYTQPGRNASASLSFRF